MLHEQPLCAWRELWTFVTATSSTAGLANAVNRYRYGSLKAIRMNKGGLFIADIWHAAIQCLHFQYICIYLFTLVWFYDRNKVAIDIIIESDLMKEFWFLIYSNNLHMTASNLSFK